MSHLVNQRFANHRANLVVVLAVFLDGTLVEGDAVGQVVPEAPRPFGQWRSVIEAVEGIGRLDLHFRE
jgi:hypothetical protein